MKSGMRQQARGNSKTATVFGVALYAVLFGLCFPVQAQQTGKVPRIGLLLPYSASTAAPWEQAFRRGLRDLGWIEGNNIRIEYRYSEGQESRLPQLAAELVHLKVDIIVTSITPDTLVAKNATTTIPIVMASVADPVGSRFVDSLARPGGNITGLTNIAWKESQVPARALGLQLYSMEARSANDFDQAFEKAAKAGVGALAIGPNAEVSRNFKKSRRSCNQAPITIDLWTSRIRGVRWSHGVWTRPFG